MSPPAPSAPRRNRGFDETHKEMISTAVGLIAENGVEALSIAALARAMGINRTTVYYHFESREALVAAVKGWAAGELARGMDVGNGPSDRIGHISHFVLDNPELIKLWIDDLVTGTDIRDSYSRWDELVEAMAARFAAQGNAIDAEVYCSMLLAATIIGPRIYARSVRPTATKADVIARFLAEEERVLRRDGLASLSASGMSDRTE